MNDSLNKKYYISNIVPAKNFNIICIYKIYIMRDGVRGIDWWRYGASANSRFGLYNYLAYSGLTSF